MSLPYHYKWEWKWKAEGQYSEYASKPTESEIADWMKEKVAQKLADKYIQKGYNVYVHDITTSVQRECFKTQIGRFVTYEWWRFTGTTITDYETDLDAKVGSPIASETVLLIVAIITLIGTLVTVAFKWYIFSTITNIFYDIAKGIREIGEEFQKAFKPIGGVAGLLVIIVALILVFFIWKPRRKKK